ncbi:MAG: hypothetical protein WBL81_06115 [Pseudolabrys sp.]
MLIVDSFAAWAIPFYPAQVSLIVPVASGCGLGVRRGPFEQCDPIYYAGYGSSYLNNYYTGFVTAGRAAAAARIWRATFTEFAGLRVIRRVTPGPVNPA